MNKEDIFFSLLEKEPFEVFRERADRDALLAARRNRRGDFLLHRAVQLGHSEACAYLLERGLCPSQPGSRGSSPLHYAALDNTSDILTLLLKAGADPEPANHSGMRPLHLAAAEGREQAVDLLLAAGASLRTANNLGRCPIHFASGSGQQDIVPGLLRRDSGLLELPDSYGQRPLHWARLFRQRGMANLLEEYGADASAPDYYGRSSRYLDKISPVTGEPVEESVSDEASWRLHRSVCAGDMDQLRTLLGEGCHLLQRNLLGRNALHLAAINGHRKMYHFLSRAQVEFMVRDDYGWLPDALFSFWLIRQRKDS